LRDIDAHSGKEVVFHFKVIQSSTLVPIESAHATSYKTGW